MSLIDSLNKLTDKLEKLSVPTGDTSKQFSKAFGGIDWRSRMMGGQAGPLTKEQEEEAKVQGGLSRFGGQALDLGSAGFQKLGEFGEKAGKGGVLDAASGVGGMASDTGGKLMQTGNPYAVAAGAVLKFGGEVAKMPGKLKEWGDHLHEQNRAFAQWSASMAAVIAIDDARRIQLERDQGERRAGTAKELADARFRLDSSLAPIEDAFANLKNSVIAKLTTMLGEVTAGLQNLLILLKLIDKEKPVATTFPQDLEKKAQDVRDRRPRHMR